MKDGESVFRSAVIGDDGTVNVGYLALYWLLIVVIGVVPFMCLVMGLRAWLMKTHDFDVQSLGVAVGAVAAGFSTALAAVGVFLWGDSRRAVGTEQTTLQRTTTVTQRSSLAPEDEDK